MTGPGAQTGPEGASPATSRPVKGDRPRTTAPKVIPDRGRRDPWRDSPRPATSPVTRQVRTKITDDLRAYAERQLLAAEDQALFVKITSRAAGNSMELVAKLRNPARQLIMFQRLRARPVTEKELLSPSTIADFAAEAGDELRLSDHTVKTYMTSLWRLYEHAPHALSATVAREQAGPTSRKPVPKTALHDDAVRALFAAAWAQRRRAARDAALGMLVLGLGSGLRPTLMKKVRGTYVFERAGEVEICIPTPAGERRLWVLRRYQPLLLELAERAGSRLLLGRYVTGVNATGTLTWKVDLGENLNVHRLVTTYQHELAEMFQIQELTAQLGHSSLNTIGKYARALPPLDLANAAQLLCGSDETDGPWSPGWWARVT